MTDLDPRVLAWIFAGAVTLHNLEEAIWLPGWSARAGRWHPSVQAPVFRFAVAVLTILAWVAAWLAATGGPKSVGAYFVCGYALTMMANAFMPHLAATIALKRYAPGTATAFLLNLPAGSLLLHNALTQGFIRPRVFAWAGPATLVAILASIPTLFALGRKLTAKN